MNAFQKKFLKKLVEIIRQKNRRKEKTGFIIVDAQNLKNTDTAEKKGYDGGKKISGIKRHIAVDTQELPHCIHITTANITDRVVIQEKNLLMELKYCLDAQLKLLNVASYTLLKLFRKDGCWNDLLHIWKSIEDYEKNCEIKINTGMNPVILAFYCVTFKKTLNRI